MFLTVSEQLNKIYINGVIDDENLGKLLMYMDVMASKASGKTNPTPITLVMCTAGGKATCGFSIIDRMQQHRDNYPGLKYNIETIGCVGSMAFIIALSGDELITTPNTYFHWHRGYYGCNGSPQDHIDMMYRNKIIFNNIKKILLAKTVWTEEEIDAVETCRKEIYMSQEEFLKIYLPNGKPEVQPKEEPKVKAKVKKTKTTK